MATHAPRWPGLPAVQLLVEDAAPVFVRDICNNRYSFLNVALVSDEAPWHDAEMSQLWRYQLHYFDYVRELALFAVLFERDTAYQCFRSLARSWVKHNAILSGDGWHPYTVSVRIVNWCTAAEVFAPELESDPDFANALCGSIYGQARFLASNLETDVGGNHIVKNLRALIWAGIFFEGAESRTWLYTGVDGLKAELRKQILADGGHFERTPGYHVQVMRDVLETSLFLERNGRSANELIATLHRMRGWLAIVLPTNGRIPLLKDTTSARTTVAEINEATDIYLGLRSAPSLATTYSAMLFDFGVDRYAIAKPALASSSTVLTGSVLLQSSGYAVFRDDAYGDHLILDVGKPCPDDLPAHAHADMLTFELTIGGTPVIVDSGVYEYKSGPWRDYFRSTRAHNTISIEDEDQSEVWSSFRVARRAQPRNIVWRTADRGGMAACEHDGYRRLRCRAIHRRSVACVDRGWLIQDSVTGRGAASAVSYIHFHPGIVPSAVGHRVFALGSSGAQIEILGDHPFRWVRGYYSEEFGRMSENAVLCIELSGLLPWLSEYVISVAQSAAEVLDRARIFVPAESP